MAKKPTIAGVLGRGLKKGITKAVTDTAEKNKRRLAVLRAKEARKAGEKPKTEVKIKPKKTKAQKRKTKEQQINASIVKNGLEATKKRFGAKLVESLMPNRPPRKGYTPTAELTPSGHPLTGKLGGRGGLSFKEGGKIISRNKGGSAKPKLKKPTPLSILGRGLKKGIERVVTDIKPLPGRTITGKRKTPKDPKRIAKAERLETVQSRKGADSPVKPGQVRTTKRTPSKSGEKTVGTVQGAIIPGKGRKRPGVGRIRKTAKPRIVSDAEKVVTKRNLRRFGTRAAAIAAGAYTTKKISDALTGPKVAVADKPSSGGSYKVKKGDSLSMIAKKNGTTLSALLKANKIPLKDANKLSIGQSLKLPAKVKNRKSVYQGMKKSEMKKIAMPKKKKMGGGKVYRRGGGKALRGFGKATYSDKLY